MLVQPQDLQQVLAFIRGESDALQTSAGGPGETNGVGNVPAE